MSELERRVAVGKSRLADRLMILGHHYQRDEVMQFADARGDSLALSRTAAGRRDAEYIVFCGVHFMAEAADILTADDQSVILPDLNAGCSMADMADIENVEEAWDELGSVVDTSRVMPITYINSSAALKAFVGRHGGSVCTSSNAGAVMRWALGMDGTRPRADRLLFVPDQHLGRNTSFELGLDARSVRLWDPAQQMGGLDDVEVKEATVLLWKGHCSVHQRFTSAQVLRFREDHPEGMVVVHPECDRSVVEVADSAGSTDFIIRTVREAAPGSVIAVGTEVHLVNRLANEHPDRTVLSLDPIVCACSTMFRIDLPHLCWVLDGLAEGQVRNRIQVDPETAGWARVALDRMLQIS
jgi:quinolinate synthase